VLFIKQELTYDLHYKDGSRIYRILRQSAFRGEFSTGVHFPAPFSSTLLQEYPEFELTGHYNAGEFFGAGSNEVRRTDQLESMHEESFVYIDQGLLEILEAPFIMGSVRNALTKPGTIVITKRIADKYFPNEEAVGKTLILNNDEERQYTITA
jgi:putative ABC transport system permease protein